MSINKIKRYKLGNEERFEEFLRNIDTKEKYTIFRELSKDTVGRSGANAVWGYIYSFINNKLKYKGIGLHKEFNYDFPEAAYAEKLWSIIGKKVLKDTRVPDIDIVEEEKEEISLISYRLLDNDKEDLIHISDILFNKFDREEIKAHKDMFSIDDILKSIEMQIKNKDNYKIVEKSVIQAILLDAITNNGDRHDNNWALIRNKNNNYYELAVYDNSSAFIDMFREQRQFTARGWSGSYLDLDNKAVKLGVGSNGDDIINYINKNYKEYFENFVTSFDDSYEEIIKSIPDLDIKVDKQYLIKRLKEKKKFLDKVKEKGEKEI